MVHSKRRRKSHSGPAKPESRGTRSPNSRPIRYWKFRIPEDSVSEVPQIPGVWSHDQLLIPARAGRIHYQKGK